LPSFAASNCSNSVTEEFLAAIAGNAVPAKRSSAAIEHRPKRDTVSEPVMRPCQMRLVLLPGVVARSTYHVGHLDSGPAHRLYGLLSGFAFSIA
jgi:hypothetical protein